MIRRFRMRDTKSLNKWLVKRGLKPEQYMDLPAIGFIVPGVAIGFLRQCEGGYAIMDSLVSNPHVSPATRHSALDKIYAHIIKVPGFNKILGFTVDEGALERAKRHGFKQIHHAILALTKE